MTRSEITDFSTLCVVLSSVYKWTCWHRRKRFRIVVTQGTQLRLFQKVFFWKTRSRHPPSPLSSSSFAHVNETFWNGPRVKYFPCFRKNRSSGSNSDPIIIGFWSSLQTLFIRWNYLDFRRKTGQCWLCNCPHFTVPLDFLSSLFQFLQITAIEPCQLWAIERNVFHAIMVESAREKTLSLKRHLKWSARFGGYPEEVLLRIAEFCTEMRYDARDELVVKPQYVYLVCRGSVSCPSRNQTSSSSPSPHFLFLSIP